MRSRDSITTDVQSSPEGGDCLINAAEPLIGIKVSFDFDIKVFGGFFAKSLSKRELLWTTILCIKKGV